MKVLFRNFIRLLSIGAFDSDETIEPMSTFKWNKLLRLAEANAVADFVYSGIIQTTLSGKATIPQNISKTLQDNGVISKTQKYNYTTNSNPYSLQKAKRLSNFYLNRKYNKIIQDEIHSIDTSTDSLIFLDKLTNNISTLINSGINIRELSDLGFYLRNNGDKVDFIKIDTWTRQLRMKKAANLIGCHLMLLFHFEASELPFLKEMNKMQLNALSTALEQDIAKIRPTDSVAQNKGNSINPIRKPDTHPLKYFTYYPIETVSRFLANTAKSLSNIDE